MGTRGMKTLAAELLTNSTLEVLDVSYNNIKKSGASVLAESLHNSKESTFAKLFAVDRKIEGFYAGSNGAGPEGILYLLNALKLNYTLKDLRLEANKIGDIGAMLLVESLAENEHRSTSAVEKLVLGWNDIGVEGAISIAEALKGNETLRYIDLSGNAISCTGAEALAEALSYNHSLHIVVYEKVHPLITTVLQMWVGERELPVLYNYH